MSNKKEKIVDDRKRLETYTLQLKIVALDARAEALQQRSTALQVELSTLPRALKEIEDQRKELLTTYTKMYDELKKEFDVPEGSELNLETGEPVVARR